VLAGDDSRALARQSARDRPHRLRGATARAHDSSLNQAHLRAVLAEYQEHYNTTRPHQGIDQRVPDDGPSPRVTAARPGTCQIRRKPVLSGLINDYERAA
jgi:transposase InsO family protein